MRQLSRHAADRSGAHGQHHVAVARHGEDLLRHRGDVLDEDRLERPVTRIARTSAAAVGGDDRRLAGRVHLGQQQGIDAVVSTLTKSSKQSRVRV
jgi:hypothetical protein